MTNRVTIIEEMHQLAQAAVEKVTHDLTGDSMLNVKDFKMKFSQQLSAEILKKGNQYGQLSDGLFGMVSLLANSGWTELNAQDIPEFEGYIDFDNKTYINNIPRAYYAQMFFERLRMSMADGKASGIYKYTFKDGETMTHTPECGGTEYSHLYLAVERIESMPEASIPQPVAE